MEILVYITNQRDRVLSGSVLALYMEDNEERQQLLFSLGKGLRAEVVQLKNGDHMILRAK